MLKIFTSDVEKLYIGSDEATKAYLGSDLVYSASTAHDYSRDYLTFRITGAGDIHWEAETDDFRKTIDYSINNGTWTSITPPSTSPRAVTIPVVVGDVVRFRGLNNSYSSGSNKRSGFFHSTATFEVEGNAMSMIYGDNFASATTFPSGSQGNFYHLISWCTGLTTAENLILPATSLTTDCYRLMFYDDTALTHGPDLPAETIPSNSECYVYMFRGCTNLNYIKCMATSNTYSEFALWMQNVQTNSGTFVKNPNMSSWTRGASGIPTNWTIVDAS